MDTNQQITTFFQIQPTTALAHFADLVYFKTKQKISMWTTPVIYIWDKTLK
jgi:hypothetical protein